jgi:hypothetical protein
VCAYSQRFQDYLVWIKLAQNPSVFTKPRKGNKKGASIKNITPFSFQRMASLGEGWHPNGEGWHPNGEGWHPFF